jgi:ribosomal silencing factor RsfS
MPPSLLRRFKVSSGFSLTPYFDALYRVAQKTHCINPTVRITSRWINSRCSVFGLNYDLTYGHRIVGIKTRCRFSTSNDDASSVNQTTDSSSKILDDEWIPPNRPLVGDIGQAKLYSHIEEAEELRRLAKEIESLEENESGPIDDVVEGDFLKIQNEVVEPEVMPSLNSVDWLKTRRTMLTAQKMMKPDDASLMKKSLVDVEIPVIEHTLFTQRELVQCIEAVGGQNVEVVMDAAAKFDGRPRFGYGVLGIILVTGTNYVQMQHIADHIVRQLRRRKLEEVNVLGAESGPDGNLNDPNENWYVVDCGNYIVHIQDAVTREAVNLAALWSGKDPLRKVNVADEEAVDDYVAQYPAPAAYTAGSARSPMYDAQTWDATIKQFERNRWQASKTLTAPARSKPLVPKRKRKTSGRKT